jgi:hypothetical protein
MNDNFDLRKFLVESKAIENMNPIFRKLNENMENTQTSDSANDPLFSHGVHFKSEYARKGIPRPRVIIPWAIEGQKTIWFRYKDDKKGKVHEISLESFLDNYELVSKYDGNVKEENTNTPLNENTLRAKIREMVLAELGGGEDYDLESRKRELGIDDEEDNDYSDYFFDIDTPEDDLYEAKKKKEDVEDVPADDAELDLDMEMDAEPATPEDELNMVAAGATGDSKEMIDHLMKALDNAKASGNEKLVTQVLNTLKFAIDQSIVD